MARLAALSFGMLVAGVLLAGAELRCRSNEADLDYLWDQPARRYGTPPGLYGSNSHGFHEREWGPKAPGTRRVVVVGDSVVWGFGLALEETLTRVAEDELGAGWEVLNTAQSGYDVEQVAATVAVVARGMDPDLIVYGAYVNDVVPTRAIYVGPDAAPVWVGPDPWPLHRWSALVRRAEGAARIPDATEIPDWDMFGRGVRALRAAAGPVPVAALLLLPHVTADPDPAACSARVEEPGWCEAQIAIADRMALLLAEADIPVRSTLGDLRRSGEHAFFPARSPKDRNHPAAAGARIFGHALADLVRHVDPGPESDRPPTIPG